MDLQNTIWKPENHRRLREKRIYKRMLNNASQGLSFSEEVVCDIGAISYRKHDFSWLFDPLGPLASETRLKNTRKKRNKETGCDINSFTREAGSVLVQDLKMYNNTSKGYDAFGRTQQINVHTCLKRSSEDWEAQDRYSRWQEFKQKKSAKTKEQCIFNQQMSKDKSGPLLPLRRQHRVSDCVSSSVSMNVQNCLNKTTTTESIKGIENPHNIQNPCDCNNAHHRKNISKQEIFTKSDSSGKEIQVDLPECASALYNLRSPEFSRQEVTRQLLHYKPVLELSSSLCYAVNKWRSFWKIKLPWQSVTIEGLKRTLIDPNFPVRLEAIITCASRALNGLQEDSDQGKAVPQELQDLIVSALDDPVRIVQMAAAMCQYVMRTSNPRAKDILQSTLKQDTSGTGADSWMAAQCLAIDGETSQAVIQRLLSQHFLCDSPSDQRQSFDLLSSISRKTTLVRGLLAEELNNANWRTRVQACKSITQLRGPISKDLCNKLVHMMWNDWSCDVRKAAAQALNQLDVARDLHNELSAKLKDGPTSRRLEALIFIGQLNIMTPKLLPTFLQCFNDDFVVVRKQACLTAASLMIEDQAVLDQLINLMQNDPSWEVKVEAIDALRKIGRITPALQELLVWALHLEEEPSVRIAACEALSMLELKGPELHHFLQERYALEPNTEVQWHIEGLLKKNGYSLERDESKIKEIKQQVELLCAIRTISMKVLLMEEMDKLQEQKTLMC